jgi:hypothetical protein
MLNKKYYTLADSKVTKQLTKISSLNLNLPSYKIKHKKHRIIYEDEADKTDEANELNNKINNEINKINQLIYEINHKNNKEMYHDLDFILVMKNSQDANTFKGLIKHEYPIIQMDFVNLLIYCEHTKNNILIANHLDFNADKILMNVNFLYLNN